MTSQFFHPDQKSLGEAAVKALEEVHGTVFDPINSADLCKFF
jgi:hypothetical protein